MDWITGLQNALNYIEDNLAHEISYEIAASKACVSSYYFQKVFHIFCGYSVGEYIRNRRLTLAAQDILDLNSNRNIIDVGMKYGYSTPESFTRAYKRFHGVTPIDTRKPDAQIKSFSRLIVKMLIEGGSVMNYRIARKDSFSMLGKGVSVDMNKSPEKVVADFWKECNDSGVLKTLASLAAPKQDFSNSLTGISDSSTFNNGKYTYYICVPYDGQTIPDGYEVRHISAQTWIVFSYLSQNKSVDTIMDMLKRIFTEFLPTSAYQPTEEYQLEVYPSNNENTASHMNEIWLAVIDK